VRKFQYYAIKFNDKMYISTAQSVRRLQQLVARQKVVTVMKVEMPNLANLAKPNRTKSSA
jgi:hypothetical protein